MNKRPGHYARFSLDPPPVREGSRKRVPQHGWEQTCA